MPSAPMGIYERRHDPLADTAARSGVSGEPFRYMPSASGAPAGCSSSGGAQAMERKLEPSLHPLLVQDVALQEAQLRRSPDSSDQEPARPGEKIQRRLAQNREAARKSRLRKKAYIQILETSRMKLAHMEQELNRARQQVVYAGGSSSPVGLPASFNPGVAVFEMEYTHWVEEQGRQTEELRTVLQQPDMPELRLRALAEAGLAHYDRLFRAKSAAAKSDVFFVIVRRVEARRRALFPLDRRLPPLRPPQGPGAAAGAADGGAGGGGGPAAADGAASGGRAVAGHGEAPAIACRVPAAVDGGTRRLGRLYVVRWHRVYAAADGERDGQAGGAGHVRGAGGPPPAADVAEHVQDPDGGAGGAGSPRPRRLLPAAPCAQLSLGGAAARAGVIKLGANG